MGSLLQAGGPGGAGGSGSHRQAPMGTHIHGLDGVCGQWLQLSTAKPGASLQPFPEGDLPPQLTGAQDAQLLGGNASLLPLHHK